MSTIKQKTAVVQIENGPRIEVRRMRWKATSAFMRMFSATVRSIWTGKEQAIAKSVAEAKDAGDSPTIARIPSFFEIIIDKLPELVAESEELALHLATQSTDLNADQFNDLDALAALEIIKAALSINCDDDLKNCLAGIAASIAGLMPAKPKTN